MITLVSALAGGLWGGYMAKRSGGNRLDIAQYATVGVIAGALVGLTVSVILDRTVI